MIIKTNINGLEFNSFDELLDYLKQKHNLELSCKCDLMIAIKGKQNSIGEILALLDENKSSIDYEIL